ncbi:MAG: hypothetical protein SGPRY_013503, partial [Prymnesium sp.]
KASAHTSTAKGYTELSKIVVVTLKAALEERGLDASGPKAQLVVRLLHALNAE